MDGTPEHPKSLTPRPEVRTQRDRAAEDARARILASAAECLVRDGLANARMARIAAGAGVSAGLLHYHFDTKELLFGEVLRYSHEVSAELMEEMRSASGALLRGAALGLLAYATYDLTNQATLRGWPWSVTLADMAWGTVATGLAAWTAAAVMLHFQKA